MLMTFDGSDELCDLARVQAAKTPGWRHGTKKRTNKEKQKKAAKVRAMRAAKRKKILSEYAKASVAAGRWKHA